MFSTASATSVSARLGVLGRCVHGHQHVSTATHCRAVHDVADIDMEDASGHAVGGVRLRICD